MDSCTSWSLRGTLCVTAVKYIKDSEIHGKTLCTVHIIDRVRHLTHINKSNTVQKARCGKQTPHNNQLVRLVERVWHPMYMIVFIYVQSNPDTRNVGTLFTIEHGKYIKCLNWLNVPF